METSSVPRTSGVYVITCTVNGKIYIGSSVNLFKRWNKHRTELRCNCHHNKHLQNAWNKYGEHSFTFAVLEECNKELNVEREQHWLDILNPFEERGYNIGSRANAPTSGKSLAANTRAKISIANTGKRRTPEARARMSAAAQKRELTPDHRAKISLTLKNKKRPSDYYVRLSSLRKNRSHSPETRVKIGNASRGRKHTVESCAKISQMQSRRYIVISPEGYSFEVCGLKQFCRANGLSSGSMSEVASGKRRQYKGWKCRRIEL